MNVSRRVFLGAGVAVVAAAAYSGANFVMRTDDDIIIGVLRAVFPDMDMSEQDLTTFAHEFLEHDKYTIEKYAAALKGLRVTGPIVFEEWFRDSMPRRVAYLLEQYEREVCTKFIMSTNFLDTYAQNKPGLKYRHYFDPYDYPGSNPLARFPADVNEMKML